jgi:hypothetical protein
MRQILVDYARSHRAAKRGGHVYKLALDEVEEKPRALEHKDFPALYAAAEPYSGAGDVGIFEARNTADAAAQARLLNDACASSEKSLSIWKQIPNASRLSGNGYLALQPGTITQRLAACRGAARRD